MADLINVIYEAVVVFIQTVFLKYTGLDIYFTHTTGWAWRS